jgi:hypothetical protein
LKTELLPLAGMAAKSPQGEVSASSASPEDLQRTARPNRDYEARPVPAPKTNYSLRAWPVAGKVPDELHFWRLAHREKMIGK